VNYKRKSRCRFFLLMRSRTPPISLEFQGGVWTPKTPPPLGTPLQWVTVIGNRMWSPCVFQWWQVDKVSPIKLFDENKTLSGLNLRHLLFQQNGAPYAKRIMESVFDLWKEGKIKPVVDSTWALEDVSSSRIICHFIAPFCTAIDIAEETFCVVHCM